MPIDAARGREQLALPSDWECRRHTPQVVQHVVHAEIAELPAYKGVQDQPVIERRDTQFSSWSSPASNLAISQTWTCSSIKSSMWDGFLLGKRYLIHDRDPLFTEAVRGLLRDSGVKPLRLPANSPNLNAYAERFVLSIRRECLDRFVPLSERHLRTAVTEYVVHYHTERNHQGLGNKLLTPLPASANDAGSIVSRERFGGILNYYYCRAA